MNGAMIQDMTASLAYDQFAVVVLMMMVRAVECLMQSKCLIHAVSAMANYLNLHKD